MNQREAYALLDSGSGRKLEKFGTVVLDRPCAQAVWAPQHPAIWNQTTARFDRKAGLQWEGREALPAHWYVNIGGVRMKLAATDFGHVGLFPETRAIWHWIRDTLTEAKERAPIKFLNLFAYSGGATLAAAQAGASCCHLDASKGMVDWARENARLNELQEAPIRWIVDDVIKFLRREVKRGNRYDAILLDPPSFGRGRNGELFKVEEQMLITLELVHSVLSDQPLFIILTSHTPGFSPHVLHNLLAQFHAGGVHEQGEMLLTGGAHCSPLPSGTWARWLEA